jgi:hypothetical protein
MHSFRIRSAPPATAASRPHGPDGFLYGFSYFVQQRDAKSKRGYLQVRPPCPLTHGTH